MTFDKLKSQKEDQNPLAGDALNLSKWEEKKLGEVCEIELGKTPYRGDKSLWDIKKQTQNVWLSIADLLNTDSKFVYDSKEYVTNKAIRGLKVVQKGTLLVSFKLTLGRLAFAGRDLFTNEAIAALSIKDEQVLDKYFLYQVLSFFDWHKAAEGDVKVKGKTLNKAKLKQIPIPLPPLSEQKRIVAILDEAFEAITKAKENTEQNLKNAKEIFESYLQGVFENKGDDWEEKNFDDCIEKIIYSNKIGKKYFQNEGLYPIISQEKEFINGYWNEEKDLFKVDKPVVLFGDHTQVIKYIDFDFVLGADGVKILKPKDNIDTKYFYYYLQNIDLGSLGYARHYRLLKEINVVYPPLSEQKKIVQELDALRAETQKLEAIYTQKLNSLDELQKSLLQKALAGELVK